MSKDIESLEKYFDGQEFAAIDTDRPVASLREEARSFLGDNVKISQETAKVITEGIKYHDFPRSGSLIGVPANDFHILLAMNL